jgi:hypothetical protein
VEVQWFTLIAILPGGSAGCLPQAGIKTQMDNFAINFKHFMKGILN